MRLADAAALADDDAGEAVVADHAAPEGVVEVEHEALPRPAAGGGEEPRHELAVERPRLRGDLHLGLQPAARVVPGVEPVAGGGAGEVEEEHALGGGGVGERGVEAPDEPRGRARHAGVEPAEERRLEVEEGLLDDEGAEARGPRAQSARRSATAAATAASAASAEAASGTAPRKSRAARARSTASGRKAARAAGSRSSWRYWP